MIAYPDIDPVAFSLGPVSVHWYGMMYLLGFVAAWLVAHRRSKRAWSAVRSHQIEDLILYAALGVIIGGRLGSALFYNFDKWMADPLWVIRIWEGGMAFHGGLLGVVVAIALYARKIKQPFFAVADFTAPLVPIGLGLGRIGNFIGQELWGRQTDLPWGMVFPRDLEQLVRHPSQLYQALLEGLVLFIIVFWYSRKPRPTGAVGGVFLLAYAVFRFAVEFVRQPDSHIGFDVDGWMTRGQILCLPMAAAGILLIVFATIRHRVVNNSVK
ncbi:MAG: prolipoprotein diacylglyceryl transferase [Porticoccaceae bacterium]|nr:prolipoprotein diacylglyceryl transferase [Porticoccaceae bacterium]